MAEPLTIRRALPNDAEALMHLYLQHLTKYPPQERQSSQRWASMLEGFAADPNYHILIGSLGDVAVSSVTLVVIPNLTHNMRPYALMENVVTHADHRKRGYASALIEHAACLARDAGCYKVMLLTGSKREETLRFYERAGFSRSDKTGFTMRLP